MPNDATIIKAYISKVPDSPFSPLPGISATFSNGVTKKLFSFNPDETNLESELDFIGLTEIEADNLMFEKNVTFLTFK